MEGAYPGEACRHFVGRLSKTRCAYVDWHTAATGDSGPLHTAFMVRPRACIIHACLVTLRFSSSFTEMCSFGTV